MTRRFRVPPPFVLPNHPAVRRGGEFHAFVAAEIEKELESNSIRCIGRVGEVAPPRCVHPLGVEPNKPRKIYDQRLGNHWFIPPPTHYDNLYDLARAIPPGLPDQQLLTWDHKSGYFHVRVHPDSETYFGFEFEGFYYVFTVLPFGWNCSPYIYQTVSKAVGSWLGSLGIPNSDYLDDSANPCSANAFTIRAVKASALFLLGYFVSHKSSMVPASVQRWLGMMVDVRHRTFAIPEDRLVSFLALVDSIVHAGTVSESTLRRVAGKCVSFRAAVPGATLFARPLFDALQHLDASGAHTLTVAGDLLACLRQWQLLRSMHAILPWRSERHFRVAISIFSDASSLGWGATVATAPEQPPLVVGDLWRVSELPLHINTKEFLAIPRALAAGLPLSLRDAILRLGVDSSVAFGLLKSGRASRCPFTLEAQHALLRLEVERNLVLDPFWLPSELNPADKPSRAGYLHEETLSAPLFAALTRRFGAFSIDAMASAANAQCARYVSRFPSPSAAGCDIFTFPLGAESNVYCFPPLPMIRPVVGYLSEQRARGVLVVPLCRTEGWWAALVRFPIITLAAAGARCAVARPLGCEGLLPIPLSLDLVAIQFDFTA